MTKSLEALYYFFHPDYIELLPKESLLYRLLTEQRSEVAVWREYTNDCLELALRYELADADLVARLRKDDWESFTSTMNELRCAKLLEDICGINSLRWHPEGRRGKVGEFELTLKGSDAPIFIEVKTVFPRYEDRLEGQIRSKLRSYTEKVPIPSFLSVTIKELGMAEDFSGRKFKNFLERELIKLDLTNTTVVKASRMKLPDYLDDSTGLHLEIAVTPVSPDKLQNCHIGDLGFNELKPVENEDYIRHSLKKAYVQLPKGQRPCLVILCSETEFPIDEDDMLNALLGTLAFRITRSKNGTYVRDAQSIRKPDGFFQTKCNKKLSAVGLYRNRHRDERIKCTLEIYHNPFAVNPIDIKIFEDKGVRQLVKINETEMGWSN